MTNEIRVCIECFEPFYAEPHPRFGSLPLRCPKCRRQSDPLRRLVKRERVTEWIVLNQVDWPRLMLKIDKPRRREGDLPFLFDRRGQEFGADWSGRIVVWAKEPPVTGETVLIREMVSTWQVRAKYETHYSISASFRAGVPVPYTKRTLVPLDSNDGQIETEEHRYFVIEPAPGRTPTGQLVMVFFRTKTTIKGFGRQIFGKIVWPKGYEILASASGSYRSGRATGTQYLAVIPLDSAVRVVHSGVTGGGDSFREEQTIPA